MRVEGKINHGNHGMHGKLVKGEAESFPLQRVERCELSVEINHGIHRKHGRVYLRFVDYPICD